MTTRLYYQEPILEFEATVRDVRDVQGRQALVLDQSAFYPTGGGQLHDRGRLGDSDVLEVLVDETTQEVLHFVNQVAGIEIGQVIRGAVDGVIRRDHLQQHTGQHILSQALIQSAALHTHSFHMGQETSTIDIDPPAREGQLDAAIHLANQIVFDNRAVRSHEVDSSQLEQFNLRKQTYHGDRIRLIEIEDFDTSTCGGTHASQTGQVGNIAITATERVKKMWRVHFVCGQRTATLFRAQNKRERALRKKLSTAPDQFGDLIDQMQDENKKLRKLAKKFSAEVAAQRSEVLIGEAETIGSHQLVVAKIAPQEPLDLASSLARQLAQTPTMVAAVCGEVAGQHQVYLACSDDTDCSMAELVKTLNLEFDGSGGGSARFAQSKFPELNLEQLKHSLRKFVLGTSPN